MDEIRLDGRSWKTKEDFYNAFLVAVEAPDWHGRNLDALWDSIVTGSINRRELPDRVVIDGRNYMSVEAAEMVDRFRALIEEAERQGYAVSISLNSDKLERRNSLGSQGGLVTRLRKRCRMSSNVVITLRIP